MNGNTAPSGGASSSSKPNANVPSGNNKHQFKSNNTPKSLDGARKQAASPVDGASSRYAHHVISPTTTFQHMASPEPRPSCLGLRRLFPEGVADSSTLATFRMTRKHTDKSHSKKSTTKAWTGTNPITQRSASSSTLNGTANGQVKNDASQRAGTLEADTSSRHAHDRLLFLLANFTVSQYYMLTQDFRR